MGVTIGNTVQQQQQQRPGVTCFSIEFLLSDKYSTMKSAQLQQQQQSESVLPQQVSPKKDKLTQYVHPMPRQNIFSQDSTSDGDSNSDSHSDSGSKTSDNVEEVNVDNMSDEASKTPQAGGSLKKRSMRRILFSKCQIRELEKRFLMQRYLSATERDELSKKLDLSPGQIKIWFQNHRYKTKKHGMQVDFRELHAHLASTQFMMAHPAFPGFSQFPRVPLDYNNIAAANRLHELHRLHNNSQDFYSMVPGRHPSQAIPVAPYPSAGMTHIPYMPIQSLVPTEFNPPPNFYGNGLSYKPPGFPRGCEPGFRVGT